MTQEELAKKLGYKSKSSINKIELGKADMPTDKLIKCAEILGVAPAYLLGYTDDPNYDVAVSYEEGETLLISNYRKLDADGKNHLIKYSEFLKGEE